jgi:hypothetical protein
METGKSSLERLQTVPGRYPELRQFGNRMELGELSQSGSLDIRRDLFDPLQTEKALRFPAGKRLNHASIRK